jgi:hypothetical protein
MNSFTQRMFLSSSKRRIKAGKSWFLKKFIIYWANFNFLYINVNK